MSQNKFSDVRSGLLLNFTSVLCGAFFFLAANWSQQCYGLSPSYDGDSDDSNPTILEVHNVTGKKEKIYESGDAAFTAAASHIFNKDLRPYMQCQSTNSNCASPPLRDFFETTGRQIDIAVSFSKYVDTQVTSFVFFTTDPLPKWAWLRAQTGSQSSYYRVSTNRDAATGFFAHYVDFSSPTSRFRGGPLEVKGEGRLRMRMYLYRGKPQIHAAGFMGFQTGNKASCDEPKGEGEQAGCHNTNNPCDIDGNGRFSARDTLTLMNYLGRSKGESACPADKNFFPDYDNNGKVTHSDLMKAQRCFQQLR